jgi:hypothetical protein
VECRHESTAALDLDSFGVVAAAEPKPESAAEHDSAAKNADTNADGTPRVPDRPHCAGRTRKGQPCMRVVLSHELDGTLYCSSHAPAGAALVKWDPTRMPLCEGVLADGHSRCTRTVLEHVTVGPGVERGLCRKHLDHWATRQTLILAKPPKKKRMPALVKPLAEENGVDDAVSVVETKSLVPRERPTDLRAALQQTAEESYAEIELALREAIRSASKATKVNCPSCQHIFSVQVRDWGNVIRASSELLDRVVSKPSAAPAEVAVDPSAPMTEEEIHKLSWKELDRLVTEARAATIPTRLTQAERFGQLFDEIRETRDVLAAAQEGHDVPESRLRLAAIRAKYWGELAGMLAPFVGLELDPALTQL